MVGQAATLQLNKHELPKFEIQSELASSRLGGLSAQRCSQ